MNNVLKFFHKITHYIKNNTSKVSLIISLLALLLTTYNSYLISTSSLVKNSQPDIKPLSKSQLEKMIKGGTPLYGDPDAKITMIEFADFQCPYCGKFFSQIY